MQNPLIAKTIFSEIRKLKQEKDAVILAHYYMPPELQILAKDGGVVDFTGDSLGLSIEAAKTGAKIIVFCGVTFMAETARILNPGKEVFIPDREAGCSLASSITAKDVKALRAKYPSIPVIAYINTYAETKAECDICCTSRNALQIARSFDSDTLIFLPDVYMGRNLQKNIEKETGKKLILWHGKCEVHEQFTSASMVGMKLMYPDAEMLLHWEVPEETVDVSFNNRAGILGSTSDILRYVGESKSREFILASECDLGASLKGMYPDKEFITPCIKCPYMKKITLQNTLATLEAIGAEQENKYKICLSEDIMNRAYLPVKRMIDFT